VSWKDQIGGGLSYVIAVEDALKLDMYPEEKKDEKKAEKPWIPNKNLPALSANVKYEQAFGSVRISGLLRVLDYYKKSSKKDHYLLTWGINLTNVFKIVPEKTTFNLSGIYGMGIGSYISDFSCSPKDVYLKQDSELVKINTLSGCVSIEHRWLPQLRSTVDYRILYTPKEQKRGDDAYQQGHYASANLTYHPTDHLMVGLEGLYSRRVTIADKEDDKDGYRIQAKIGFTL